MTEGWNRNFMYGTVLTVPLFLAHCLVIYICRGNQRSSTNSRKGCPYIFSAETHIFSSVMFSIFAMHFGSITPTELSTAA